MKFINKDKIKLDKVVNELDKLVVEFIGILEKYTPYVVVSGYVAILFGRDRGTDDVDIIIPRMDKSGFKRLYGHLVKNGYWCLNSSDIDELYGLLISKHSIRFAVEPKVSPNFELKFSKDIFDDTALKQPVTVQIDGREIKTSFLELQIAYKEEILKSNKDIEDARHLRIVAKEYLNESLIKEYKRQLRHEKI